MIAYFQNKRRLFIIVGLSCLVMLISLLLSYGTTKETNVSRDPATSPAAYNAATLFKYKTAYVGNNSKVANLIHNLAYANLQKELSLQTQSVPYGITVNYDFSNVNMKIEQIEPTFRNHAAIAFALIDNVDEITFHLNVTDGKTKLRYSRSELQKSFASDLREYAKNIQSFEKFLHHLTFQLFIFPQKYTLTMSSSPGIRILADYQSSVGKVRYATDHGVLLTWDAPSGKVSGSVSAIEVPYASLIYWSPLEQNDQISVHKNSTVTVTLLDTNNHTIDEKQAIIIYDNTENYTVQISAYIVIKADSQSPVQKTKTSEDKIVHF